MTAQADLAEDRARSARRRGPAAPRTAGVLDGDDGLVGERLQQGDLRSVNGSTSGVTSSTPIGLPSRSGAAGPAREVARRRASRVPNSRSRSRSRRTPTCGWIAARSARPATGVTVRMGTPVRSGVLEPSALASLPASNTRDRSSPRPWMMTASGASQSERRSRRRCRARCWRSVGDEAMTRSTSAVAVCCSSASVTWRLLS